MSDYAFGVAAGLDPEVAVPLAARCEELGYHSIWSNDHPGAKGLETVAEFARKTSAIGLGVGVIALDKRSISEIAGDIERLDLDPGRLWLGVGAGHSKRPVTFMRESLAELRAALPGVRLVMAAMGPKMCALAGAEYDAAFFNWMTPEFAAKARSQVELGARQAGRDQVPIFGYVRTAVGDDAERRLAKEEGFYRDLHEGYRRHFERLGEPEGTVGVAASTATAAQRELSAYGALDVVVVRGLASARIETMTALAEATAPAR